MVGVNFKKFTKDILSFLLLGVLFMGGYLGPLFIFVGRHCWNTESYFVNGVAIIFFLLGAHNSFKVGVSLAVASLNHNELMNHLITTSFFTALYLSFIIPVH